MLEWVRRTASGLQRPWKRALTIVFDFVALLAMLWLSYRLRLGSPFMPSPIQLGLMALAPMIAIPIFIRMGLYRAVIRYLPERAIIVIAQAMLLSTVAWVTILFLTEMSGIAGVPRSIPIIYFTLGTLVVAASRFAVKRFLGAPSLNTAVRTQVVIYGAGPAGVQLATALMANGGRPIVGFLDDNASLQGRDVAGIRVYPPNLIGALIRNYGVGEVILSIPSLSAARRREIYLSLNEHAIKIRTLPAITDLASGKYSVGALREIDIDDLLGRSSVPANPDLLRRMLADRVILVTGAGGSIGSELARLIARWSPRRLILLEANEFALYEIGRRLAREAQVEFDAVLGSVTDTALVRRVLDRHKVDAIFHAAAHKHVSMVEANVLEGVRNNVFGTDVLARAALQAGVPDFVLISTDKAVHPTSVMGATKRWAEHIIRECAESAETRGTGQRFCAVRFGNVLGSNGSVVPLFREQIANGGPVTVTDPEMTRYFMSVHEAAELIVQAGALSQGGDIFLLEMGEPIAIRELAENMIRLAGLSVRSEDHPGGDIEIQYIGAKPGEKLREELFYDPSLAAPTQQAKILRAKSLRSRSADLRAAMAQLADEAHAGDEAAVRRTLFGFIHE